jgi:hypothetical protein
MWFVGCFSSNRKFRSWQGGVTLFVFGNGFNFASFGEALIASRGTSNKHDEYAGMLHWVPYAGNSLATAGKERSGCDFG